jgi:hypothetical protein
VARPFLAIVARGVARRIALGVALVAAATVAGCSNAGGFGVDLTLRFDDSIPDDVLARVTTLSIVSSGDETAIYQLPFGRVPQRLERLVFRPLVTSRTLVLAIAALDVDPDAQTAEVVAQATSDSIALVPAREVSVELLLGGQAGADAGIPIDDAGGADDLAQPPREGGVDLPPPPPDMASVELGANPSKCASIAATSLCESFEAGISAYWGQKNSNGSITLDATKAYRGTHSVKLHANAVAAGTSVDVRLTETKTFTVVPADFYVRAFYYLPSAPVNGVQLYSAVQNTSPYYGVQVLDSPGGFLAHGDSISGGAYHRSNTIQPPTNRWFCLEWHIHVGDAATGLQQVWLDDNEVVDLKFVEPTSPPAGFGTLSIGYEFFSPSVANPASDAWVDEILIDTQRVGCVK